MTSREMLYEFQKIVMTSDSSLFSNRLESSEIYFFINIAQKRIFKERYFPGLNVLNNILIINNNNEEIKNLIQTAVLNNVNSGLTIDPDITYSYTLDYSSLTNYAHYIKSESIISRMWIFPTNASLVSNKLISNIEVSSYITNDFHSPIIRKPAVLIEDNNIMRIFVDKYTTSLSQVNITYLRYPQDINDSSQPELSQSIHNDIVLLAVDIFRSNRYMFLQRQNNTNNNNEENKN